MVSRSNGGGVFVGYNGGYPPLKSGTGFIMYGGSITDNAANTCGGVFMNANSKMDVSGAVQIEGNRSNGAEGNLYLPGELAVAVSGELTGTIGIGKDSGNMPTADSQGQGRRRYLLSRAS